MTRPRLRPARPAAVLGLTAALVLTGCSATNPIQTLGQYDASDGLGAEVGDVQLLNMLVVAEAEGSAGVLSGALSNRSSDDQDVTLTVAGGEPVDLDVAAGSSVLLGATDAPTGYTSEQVGVDAVDAPPGGLTTLTVTTSRGGTVKIQVPVLDGTLPEYAALLDSVASASPSPETSATPEATETPEAGETPDATPSPEASED